MLENITLKILTLDLDKFHIVLTDAQEEAADVIREVMARTPGMKGVILRQTDGVQLDVKSLTKKQLADLRKVILDATNK